jgi:hypothetical protein
MPPLTIPEIYQDVLKKVENRYRWSKMDNMLENKPQPDEIQERVDEALADINIFEPQTAWTLENLYNSTDIRWKNLLILGTARGIAELLWTHWVNEGFEATIGDLSAEDRAPKYETLYNTLSEKFESKLERLKKTSQKHVRGFSSDTGATILTFRTYLRSKYTR